MTTLAIAVLAIVLAAFHLLRYGYPGYSRTMRVSASPLGEDPHGDIDDDVGDDVDVDNDDDKVQQKNTT